jgi:hypothetical protein
MIYFYKRKSFLDRFLLTIVSAISIKRATVKSILLTVARL